MKLNPEILKSIRAQLNEPREVLAVRSKLSCSTLALAERHGVATPRTIAKLAEALGVEPEALCERR